MRNIVKLLGLFGLVTFVWSRIAPLDPECQQPLGMEDKSITDSQISAPKSVDGSEGKYARLNYPNKAWCIPGVPQSTSDSYDSIYLGVNLEVPLRITAVTLQGLGEFSYGTFMRLYYKHDITWMLHDPNGENQIAVKNLSGNEYEYFPLVPSILTSQIKIYLLNGAVKKCLRMELYGCKSPDWSVREYVECSNSTQGILSSQMNAGAFSQSTYLSQSVSYSAEFLLFTKPFAWCVQLSNVDGTEPFSSFATVNLYKPYLIYALRVNGYVMAVGSNDISDKYLAESFKFEYSLDEKIWASYEGGRELKSAQYQRENLTLNIPLVAKFVRIRMKADGKNVTCIKLQLYGCEATEAEGITTTPLTTPNITNSNTSTTNEAARIYQYKTIEGDSYNEFSWTDSKYPHLENSNRELSNGLGCLTDGQENLGSTPFTPSSCWLAWHRSSTPEPFVILSFNVKTTVKAIELHSYVNESMKASPIKMFHVQYGSALEPFTLLGYACALPSVYGSKTPQDVFYRLDMNDVSTNHLQIKFRYAGDWIFLRQVSVLKDSAGSLALSQTDPQCIIPDTGGDSNEKQSSPNMIVIIICVILGLLFLALLIFVVHHYRTSLHKKFKSSHKSHFLGSNGYRNHEDRLPLNSPSETCEISNATTTTVPYAKVHFVGNADENRNSDVYADPNLTLSISSNNSADSGKPGYTQVGLNSGFGQYLSPQLPTGNGSTVYTQPSVKQQYAQPNQLPADPIYQSSAIYASTYENPYKAVVASSLYTDPTAFNSRKISRKHFKVFPRQQLSFKERIGVGQFGEVHIAEATGLDEIYGTVGHYNSWGLPDTALVAVKKLMSDDKEIEDAFMKEVEVMSRLKNENVVRLLGICNEQPMLMVVEYMENGDLNQFLRNRKPWGNDNVRISQIEPNVLPIDILLHMTQQITAAMKYLHSEGFIHRDLATRNCLVGPAYQVKVSDFGMSRYLYSKHYYRIEGKAVLPIRWMAPECLYYGTFTQFTDVWSFGVTLWEIFTFAREAPHSQISDPEIIANACEAVQNPKKKLNVLARPPLCTNEIYDILLKCWQRSPESRPTFGYLYRFFTDICATFEEDI